VSGERWHHYKDEEALRRIIERLAFADIDSREWMAVRDALLAVWPTSEDVSDRAQEPGAVQVGPEEADVDVPEV
jgi:hypothetical protein